MLKDELLKVYRHEDIGYVPIFPTDYNIIGNPLIREKGFGGGAGWFGVNWTQSEGMTAVTPVPGEVLLKDVCRLARRDCFSGSGCAAMGEYGLLRRIKLG